MIQWVDLLRAVTIFSLGVSISAEITVVRYSHVAIWAPGGDVYYVPMRAQLLRALSRVGAVFFIALELHDRFGQPFTWRIPLALAVALLSAWGTFVTARNRLSGRVG